MSERKKQLTRREFLRLAAVTTGAAALSSCTPPATPTPAAPPPAAPTAAPTVAPTVAVTKAAVAPTVAPTAAQTKAAVQLGDKLVGNLGGPQIVTDAATFPKAFK